VGNRCEPLSGDTSFVTASSTPRLKAIIIIINGLQGLRYIGWAEKAAKKVPVRGADNAGLWQRKLHPISRE
jgi:hypothetical protein